MEWPTAGIGHREHKSKQRGLVSGIQLQIISVSMVICWPNGIKVPAHFPLVFSLAYLSICCFKILCIIFLPGLVPCWHEAYFNAEDNEHYAQVTVGSPGMGSNLNADLKQDFYHSLSRRFHIKLGSSQ